MWTLTMWGYFLPFYDNRGDNVCSNEWDLSHTGLQTGLWLTGNHCLWGKNLYFLTGCECLLEVVGKIIDRRQSQTGWQTGQYPRQAPCVKGKMCVCTGKKTPLRLVWLLAYFCSHSLNGSDGLDYQYWPDTLWAEATLKSGSQTKRWRLFDFKVKVMPFEPCWPCNWHKLNYLHFWIALSSCISTRLVVNNPSSGLSIRWSYWTSLHRIAAIWLPD